MVKVPEGLVLAADSASTVEGGVVTPSGVPGPRSVLKVFFNATKVLQIRNLPVGVMTWGSGAFGSRTIASLVEEFENTEQIRGIQTEALDMSAIAQSFWAFMKGKSDQLFGEIPEAARVKSGLIICGYSGNDFFPEEYVMTVPSSPPSRVRPPLKGQPHFGANWFGATDAIVRFHHGRDDRLFGLLKTAGISDQVIEQIKEKISSDLQYPTLFEAMPLGDAVEYAEFLVRTAIGRFRFSIGAELCGGPIDIATITRKQGLTWIRRKTVAALDSTREA